MGSARGGRVRASPPFCESITRSRWVGSCYSGASTPSPAGLLCVPWTGESHLAPRPAALPALQPCPRRRAGLPGADLAAARAGGAAGSPLPLRVAGAGSGRARGFPGIWPRPRSRPPPGPLPAPARPVPSARGLPRPSPSARGPALRLCPASAARGPSRFPSGPCAPAWMALPASRPRSSCACVARRASPLAPARVRGCRRGRAPFPPPGLCPRRSPGSAGGARAAAGRESRRRGLAAGWRLCAPRPAPRAPWAVAKGFGDLRREAAAPGSEGPLQGPPRAPSWGGPFRLSGCGSLSGRLCGAGFPWEGWEPLQKGRVPPSASCARPSLGIGSGRGGRCFAFFPFS